MKDKPLLAKSARKDGSPPITLLQHTQDVFACAQRLWELTGDAQLGALKLDSDAWRDRFLRDLRIAALLHDLGKANSYFQTMINGDFQTSQPIRHEAVSYWIARWSKLRPWLEIAAGGADALELVLWAVAGHHRKFPRGQRDGRPMTVHLGHPEIAETLRWGAEQLGLQAPPLLEDDKIHFDSSKASALANFGRAEREAGRRAEKLSAEEARYAAMLKAALIAADVAGSIRARNGQAMVDWMARAFANVPSAADLDRVVAWKLGGKSLLDFQRDVAPTVERPERVVLVRAGCGSGKTLAAYHWAARTAERMRRGLRVFFCYPTTGTATEGYRDYLKDVDFPDDLKALIHGRAPIDMELLGLGDDEPGGPEKDGKDHGPGSFDGGETLDHWSTCLVSCTVDTVLGLLQNNRRGLYLWPSIAGAAVVFDEIHSYDDRLFNALLRFLETMRGVPCLLMTASLPEARLERIQAALAKNGEHLRQVDGPENHETIKRYRRTTTGDPVELVNARLRVGKKILWVVNTVDEAIGLFETFQNRSPRRPLIYHSRFRYVDRLNRHNDIIKAFQTDGPVLAFCTQVAEMSLDLSADLLVTRLAPIAALIQRLGRLNRRATRDDAWPFVVYGLEFGPKNVLPYRLEELEGAKAWLESLGTGELSQRDLANAWLAMPERPAINASANSSGCIWLDGGFETTPRPLREGSPGITIIRPEDAECVRRKALRPEQARIPMNVPRDRDWHSWEDLAFCKVPPVGRVEYCPMKGARWTPVP